MRVLGVFAGLLVVVNAVGRVVDLGNARYQGRIVGDGTTQWLGMRYASAPLGKLRFRAPVDPQIVEKVQDASSFGNICLSQSPSDWTNKPSERFTVGEDCLFVNVFAPSNATEQSRLPVMFFIQGGAFTSNSNANYNGSDLAKLGNMVIVSINYRVGPYGFLSGEEVVDGSADTNNGIRDQIKALEWTKRHVQKFGGNPDHIVLNGDSAGAMSIVILMASPSIKNKKLFKGVIAESTGVIPLKILAQAQVQFDCLAKAVGCSNATESSSIECLREVNATALQTTTCQFGPTFDTDIIPSRLLLTTAYAETLSSLPTVFGTTANEGTDTAPTYLNSTSDFRTFFSYVAPFLSASALDDLVTIYASGPQPQYPNAGRLWRAASNAVGDFGFKCPSRAYAGNSSWIYDWTVLDPELDTSGLGAYHTVELHAIWGPNNTDMNPPKSYLPGGVNADVVPLIQGYVASFVRWLDPNVARWEQAPVWEKGGNGRTLRIGGVNGTRMGDVEEVEGEGFVGRCKILWPMVEALEVTPPEGMEVDLAKD